MVELVFKENIILEGKIEIKTGMHIGGIKEELEIGGVESPVIIDPITGNPVIPGSTLKGKMRTLLELSDKDKLNGEGKVHECKDPDCYICNIFGSSEEVQRGPTRIIVRDAFLEGEIELEVKAENVINRIEGKAEHPRFLERVPAGSKFDLDIVYAIYNDNDVENFKVIFEGMKLIEDNYLGGSGTRGYGKVVFQGIKIKIRTKDDYKNGSDGKFIEIDGADSFSLDDIIKNFENIKQNF